MAKGIIVMDVPKTCWECPCYMEGYLNGSSGGDWCKVTGKEVYSYINKRGCPIKPMPKKKVYEETVCYKGRENGLADMLIDALEVDIWNECIDKILGE